MAFSALPPPPPPPPLVVLILLLLSCFISTASCSLRPISDHKPNTKPLGFTTRVFHRDSPESPFYDPKLTDTERWSNAVERSFDHYTSTTMQAPNDMRAPIYHRNFEYVASFHIGTPPFYTYSVIDTGSDLTWLQCRPCDNCYDQEIPIFDPRKSTSYAKVGCEDDYCDAAYNTKCDNDGTSCLYGIRYADLGQSLGTLSSETFIFLDDTTTGNISVPKFPFGCGHNNSFPYLNGTSPGRPGVFGLSKEPLSWIHQLSFDAFSHCFETRQRQQTSLLRFGADAIITANSSTPMVEYSTYTAANYYVGLEGISVGSTKLNIPELAFEMSEEGEGGVIIDTGSATTHLTKEAYDPLIAELVKQIKLERVWPPSKKGSLCYNLKKAADIISLPEITFHFSGLDFVVHKWNVWLGVGGGNICLTLVRAGSLIHTGYYLTIIGAQHLQNVNVGYDFKNKAISLLNKDCSRT